MAHPHNQDIRIECLDKSACAQCGAVVDLAGKEAFAVVQCPRCQARFTAPGKLGNLALLKVLGKGQMGVTFKAHDRSLGRSVAVKVMRTAGDVGRKAIDDFFSEARALGVLDHPNVAKIYSLVENAECPYIVMELLEGGSMEKQFDKGRPMEEVRALEIGMGVAKALSAASEVGLIHGDVKPGNVMLDEKGRAKLVDFGIARFGGGRTNELDALGTPYYASPEQVLRKSVDFRTDIYSLGATLFHALTGVPPFPGTVLKEVLAARLKGPAPDLRSVRTDLHPKTAAVVARMLEADPDKRYASYEELRAALEDAYAEAAGLQAPLPETPAPGVNRLMFIGGALAAMIVAGVLVAFFLNQGAPKPPATTSVTDAALPPAARPTLSPPERAIAQETDVAISCDTPGATIRFTLDGGEPTGTSEKYVKSVPIAPGTTIKARAFAPGCQPSGVAAATYALDTSALTDIVPLRTSANDAWAKVKTLDGGQGFKAQLDAAKIVHDTAEELYQQKAYGPAGKAYGELTAACTAIKTRQEARLKALRAQEKGKELAAVLAGLPKEAQSWKDVAAEQKEADVLFEAGRFDEALARWGKADLKARALLQSAAKDAQKQYRDQAAQCDMAMVTAFGGKSYQELQAALDKADKALAAGDFLAATTNYHLASKVLPSAAVGGKLRQGARAIQDKVALALQQAKDMQLARADNTIEEILKLDPYQPDAWTLRNLWAEREMAVLPLDGNPASATAIKLVMIKPGTFQFGPPGHSQKVTLTKSYYMGQYELTRGQYELFVKARQSVDKTFKTQAEHDNEAAVAAAAAAKKPPPKKPIPTWNAPGFTQDGGYPVTSLTWKEAEEFCAWASERTGATLRLPTEAEWEYACRAGTATPFSFVPPTDLPQYGNYADKRLNPAGFGDDGAVNTASVGKYKPNPWKLYDMHGNVAEWCSDWFAETPTGEKDPAGPASGVRRVARGGSWTAKPQDCASYSRVGVPPTATYWDLGFRVAASTVPEKAFTSTAFLILPPAPPLPDVQASEQAPLPGSSDFANNLSFTHAPLKLGSVDYQQGFGVGSPSNLILSVQPKFKRFVAIAGLDENQRSARPNSALRCRVYFDDVEVASTPVLRYSVGASSWPFDVKIPDGVRLIRLVVEEVTLGATKGDGHINWVNTGFCTEGH